MNKQILRKLGYREASHVVINYTTVIGVLYFTGDTSLKTIISAIEEIWRYNPWLQATIKKYNNEYYFYNSCMFNQVPNKIIHLEDKPTFSNKLMSVVEKELIKTFDIEKFLWRYTILSYCDNGVFEHCIVLSIHHSISDGLSLMGLINNLINLISQKFVSYKKTPLLPKSLEDFAKKKYTYEDFAKYKKDFNQRLGAVKPLQYRNYVEINHRRQKIILSQINPLELQHLKKKCKKHGVTINSYLCATIILAGYNIKLSPESIISLLTAINLRGIGNNKISNNTLGLYASAILTLHKPSYSQKSIWDIAVSYQQQLHEQQKLFVHSPLQYKVDDILPIDFNKTHFEYDFGLSNLGNISLDINDVSLVVKKIFFCGSQVIGDIGFTINVCTINDYMHICYTYVTTLFDDKTAIELSNEVTHYLKES